jgi:arylsulfatase A-like enzyme
LPVLLNQPTVKRDAIFWHFPGYLEGYNADKRSKDIFRTRPVSAVRSGDYKLLEFYEDQRVELYNIKDDIGETKDLAAKHPAKKKELYDKLQQWKKKVNAPVPTQANPLYKP